MQTTGILLKLTIYAMYIYFMRWWSSSASSPSSSAKKKHTSSKTKPYTTDGKSSYSTIENRILCHPCFIIRYASSFCKVFPQILSNLLASMNCLAHDCLSFSLAGCSDDVGIADEFHSLEWTSLNLCSYFLGTILNRLNSSTASRAEQHRIILKKEFLENWKLGFLLYSNYFLHLTRKV